MSGATLNLEALQSLISLGGYGGTGYIETSSAVLGLSAALFLSDLGIWQGAGHYLTDDEIDDIQAMIARLESDLMLDGSTPVNDHVKATKDSSTSVLTSTAKVLVLNTEIYDSGGLWGATHGEFINIQTDGVYIFDANLTWSANAAGNRRLQLYRRRSGTAIDEVVAQTKSLRNVGVYGAVTNMSFQDECFVGDKFWLEMWQNSGITLTVASSDYSPIFAATRVGDL